ncbi:MAG: S-formylglutathione hydrolase, partial [Gammaproteobacteria bacterium]
MDISLIKRQKSFGGSVEYYRHDSEVNQSEMTFSVFLPPTMGDRPTPVLYWLSGLTCSEDNFMSKAGAQRVAAELGLMIVVPDTSSRNNGIEGEDESYDFGSGAGFYLNATTSDWSKNYNMYDYVTQELPRLIEGNFNVDSGRKSISGHSMGGHGALTIALKNPGVYRSVSAFSPIVAPMDVPWGQKAFQGYLGEDKALWEEYDASRLVRKAAERLPLFIDQGGADEFLVEQLKPHLLEKACKEMGHPLELRIHDGYDHSYFFIASFIEEH